MSKFFKPLIGLEMHVELSTKSKMFCQCDADWQKYLPNENTCPVCLGLPGALPVPNRLAVEYAICIAQALGCKINKSTHFDRKHYFYADLPKGYQISQYDEPIGVNGVVKVFVKNEANEFIEKSFRIHRVHLEEDTGKLTHGSDGTSIDFNRSSVPLVEIVTEADFDSSEDVKSFLQELHTIITYLKVSNADMDKGSMRLEPNISVRSFDGDKPPTDWTKLPFPDYKVEVKNINSFNFVKKAIDFEVKRQTELLSSGVTPPQETRGWNENKGITFSQRLKENAHDYRYFPEPDIPPMVFSDEYLSSLKSREPMLPIEKVKKYNTQFGIKINDSINISRDPKSAKYFDDILPEFTKVLSKSGLNLPSPGQFVANALLNKKILEDQVISEAVEKLLILAKPKETDAHLLGETIAKVIAANPKSVEDYKSGKLNAIMFLVGQVMREMKGQADALVVKSEIEIELKK